MKSYVSLIIDIEKSRMYEVDERNEIQNYMSHCIDRLNVLHQKNIEFPLTFSGGDELQGLFKDVTTAILYYRLFEMLMAPVRVRAGIGIGEWTVKVEDGLSTQQDGPAYHKARKAIEDVYKKQSQNVRIFSGEDDILVNHLMNASIVLKRQQIYMQNIVLVILELLYPFTTTKMTQNNDTITKDLLDHKFDYRVGRRGVGRMKRNSIVERKNYNMDEIHGGNPIMIDGNIAEPEEVILRKNMALVISKILGSSRQNVDSIMRRGNVNKIRELDFMALQYIEKKYGKEG